MVTLGDGSFDPPRPRRLKAPWIVAAAIVLAGAVTGGAVAYQAWQQNERECAPHILKRGDREECIGLSDGSFSFGPSLDVVMDKIKKENDRVEASGKPFVSLAYVEPLTTAKGEEETKYGLRAELEGAYLAQRELNEASLGGHGDLPRIRLLVGNLGLRSEQWRPLTEELVAKSKDKNHLIAVAGFGQSRGGTKNAVDALRDAGIPMMGATVTADSLAEAARPGFFRTSPPNRDQAGAVVNYLVERQKDDPSYTVAVIRDRNEDDIYNTSMFDSFATAAAVKGLKTVGSPLEFLSGVDGISNAFSSVADKVCALDPDAVFFAGRGVNVRNFIYAMSASERRCPVTLITGDDAVGAYFGSQDGEALHEKLRTEWTESKVTVLYTSLAHPSLATKLYAKEHDPIPGFLTLYSTEFGGDGAAALKALQNGQVIMGHDAVWALGVAVRNAAGPEGNGQVNTGSTLQMLLQLSGRFAVSGLSGPTSFASDGNPDNKAMALVQMEPSEGYTFKRVVRP